MASTSDTLPSLEDIAAAQRRIAGHLHRTPLSTLHSLCNLVEPPMSLYIKEEQRQKTGSFKARGALNRIATLSPEQREQGLVTVSAGNHAAAVAWAAAAEGAQATVVMRKGAAANKVAATRAYGATVDLFGDDHLQAFDHAHDLERDQGFTFIPPYDDPMVIAGTGTVGAEILEDLPDPDVIIVPVGGGGLISGISLVTKLRSPKTRVIGVEPEGAQTVTAALSAGEPVNVMGNTIADGLAAPFTGRLNLEAVQKYVDEIVLVTDDEIRAGMRMLLERAKALAEPAGAAGLAALLADKISIAGKKVVVVISGGNVDVARLPELLA